MENALDAIPSGGVVRLRAGRSDRPGYGHIVVEGTGPGTPSDLLERAGRAEQPGLATVAALLEVLGGELRLTFAEGRGARVTIESPFYVPPIESRPAEPVRLEGTVLLGTTIPTRGAGSPSCCRASGSRCRRRTTERWRAFGTSLSGSGRPCSTW